MQLELTGKVLVVVDMEPGYKKAVWPGLLNKVEALLEAAVAAESLVVFLEFGGGGTYRRLLRKVRRYDMFVRECKERCDGADKVLEACARGRYDTDAFVVCGVETSACVAETARSLALALPGSVVEVVTDACGDLPEKGGSDENGNDWQGFYKSPANLRLVTTDGAPYDLRRAS